MKSTAKREVLTGVITFLVYGILGFAAYLLTALPEAGLDSLAPYSSSEASQAPPFLSAE